MRDKRILFQGSVATEDKSPVVRLCEQLAHDAIANHCCMIFGGAGELELRMAEAIARACEQNRVSPSDHLIWRTCGSQVQDPRARIGQRYELGELFAYGSFARLRTHLISCSDALITVGGAKGVLDSIEKARLTHIPFFPIPLGEGESRAAWRQMRYEQFEFCSPSDFQSLGDQNKTAAQISATIFAALRNFWQPRNCKVFIVHGHDGDLKYALKDFIQNHLRLGEPVILRDEPGGGRTIIEKLEDCAGQSNLVFVLMTPDDRVATGQESNESRWRCRQNVIFEMGYFLGKWGRRSGKVLLLHKGAVELPSDIGGITYIPISADIKDAGERIRMELKEWL